MNRKAYLFLLLSALFCSCKSDELPATPGTEKEPQEEGLPVPPENSLSSNVFCVDFFSTLEDDGDLFAKTDVSVASQYIKEQTGMRSVVYMFDRADFTKGVSYSLNKMSYDIEIYQFFAQHQKMTTTVTQGTGIATKYTISRYDGIAQNDTYMSGCTLPVPISTPVQLCLYTTRIESMDQIKEIYAARSKALLEGGVIIGTVRNDIKDSVLEYIEDTMSLRALAYGSKDTELDLLVVVPASYVCRGIEDGKKDNLPYYRISIEKWM